MRSLKEKIEALSKEDRTLLLQKLRSRTGNNQQHIGANTTKSITAYITTREAIDTNNIKAKLRQELPEYMIPAHIVPISSFPRLPNGKVDKKALLKMSSSKSQRPNTSKRAPGNKTEALLAKIWSEVLQIKDIGVNDNFFEIGGDSISSIQIVAKARKEGMQLAPNQIFEQQTIAELALFSGTADQNQKEDSTVSGDLPLTPIQHWFFETHKLAPHYWNHVIAIEGISVLDPHQLKEIISKLTTYHEALRLSFYHKKGDWLARILPPHENGTCFYNFDLTHLENKTAQDEEIIALQIKHQQDCNLAEGGLFRALYFDCGELQDNHCYLIAHHLIIDIVSWNSIFNDILLGVSLIKAGDPITFKPKSASLKDYAERQLKLANSEILAEEIPYWVNQSSLAGTVKAADTKKSGPFSKGQIAVFKQAFDKEVTDRLRLSANVAYNTNVEDLLIVALVLSFSEWSSQESLSIGLERHGRSSKILDLDISNTVGWFTSFFPQRIDASEKQDLSKLIPAIKEQLHTIPNTGIGYGILKYLAREPQLSGSEKIHPPLVFNYTGRRTSASENTSVNFSFYMDHAFDTLSEQQYYLEINSHIDDDILKVNWSYAIEVVDAEEMSNLAALFQSKLKTVIEHCLQQEETYFTPSDFPEALIDQTELNQLVHDLGEAVEDSKASDIEAILPLREIQQAMLLHHLYNKKDEGFLIVQFKIKGQLNTSLFKQAWSKAIDRHSVLRSSIYWEKLQKPVQLIQKRAAQRWRGMDWKELSVNQQEEEIAILKSSLRTAGINFQKAPMLDFYLIDHGGNEHTFLWPNHHLLVDGWSTNNIIDDVLTFYDALVNQANPGLPTLPGIRSYYNWVLNKKAKTGEAFWTSYFEGFKEANLLGNVNQRAVHEYDNRKKIKFSAHDTERLLDLAKRSKVSLNTLISVSWGLLLSKYFDTGDIVFGVALSGRSNDYPNMDLMAGMFMNVLPQRILFDSEEPISEILQRTQKLQIGLLQFEHISETDILSIIKRTQGTELFDTLLIFENFPWTEKSGGEIHISNFKSGITSNYPLTLVVVPNSELEFTFYFKEHLIPPRTVTWIIDNWQTLIRTLLLPQTTTTKDLEVALAQPERALPGPSTVVNNNKTTSDAPRNALELELLRIWESMFKKEGIGINDDYFELGGTSLMAIKLFPLIEKSTGINLPPTTLLFSKTIAQIARELENHSNQKADSFEYIIPLRTHGTEAPVFCVHGGDGHVLFYNRLPNHLNKNRPVYLVQPKGINGSGELHGSIEEMSRDYLSEIFKIEQDGPYNIMFFCYSALAVEIATILENMGKEINLIIVDSSAQAVTQMPKSNMLSRLKGYLGRLYYAPLMTLQNSIVYRYRMLIEPVVIKLTKEKRLEHLTKLRGQLSLIHRQYKWKKFNAPCTLFLTNKEPAKLREEKIKRWRYWSIKEVEVRYNSGNHLNQFQEPHVQSLGQQLEEVLL